MRILLDTHAFPWFIAGHPQLSTPARTTIADPSAEPFLSIASVWEMAIKISLGKLTIGIPAPPLGAPPTSSSGQFAGFITTQLRHNGIALLAVSVDHVAQVVTLPFHHRDPFDRLLVAQALVDQLPIVSGDASFSSYPVQRIW
jgi:PIN domain nuclease of toxin-antitoxin system